MRDTAAEPTNRSLSRAPGTGKLGRGDAHVLRRDLRIGVPRGFPMTGFLLAAMLLAAAPALAWEHWGGDRGGMRFSPLSQITPENVGQLVRAWEFHTGDLQTRAPDL